MTRMYGISSDSISTMFSSLNGRTSSYGNSASGTTGSILADYASIRSGSYYRLVKNYYKQQGSDAKSNIKSKNTTEAKTLTGIKADANELLDSATKLMGTNFDPKTDKDREKVYDNLKAFVEDYNDTINAAKDATNTSVLSAASSMVKSTAVNAGLLGKVGITINKDNTMKLNEDMYKDKDGKMKEVDMTPAKSLFKGVGSYAHNLNASASYLSMSATNAASRVTTYGDNARMTKANDFSSVFDNIV